VCTSTFFFEDHTNVFNRAISFSPPEENWDITLGCGNLTDTRYVVSGFENAGAGFTSAVFSRPREWYLTISLRR